MSLLWQAALKGSATDLPRPSVNLAGSIAIVTGSNAGLGKEVAGKLAAMKPAKLILAVRTVSKGEAARADILAANPRAVASSIEVWPLDMASFASVKAFGQRVNTELPRLDVLIANAGIQPPKFEKTRDGWESTVQVNVLATWYLVQLILPIMTKTASTFYPPPSSTRSTPALSKPHLDIVSSGLHYLAKFKEGEKDNILGAMNEQQKSYAVLPRYQDTKLMEVYLVGEFLKRHGREVEGIVINTSNPGWCDTSLQDSMNASKIELCMKKLMARTTEMGARAITWAAVLGEKQGAYSTNCVDEDPAPAVRSPKGQAIQERLYNEVIEVLAEVDRLA